MNRRFTSLLIAASILVGSLPLSEGQVTDCYDKKCADCTSFAGTCNQCKDTYTLLNVGYGTKPCGTPILNCDRYSTSGECSQCLTPYTLSADQLSCNDCSSVANCKSCSKEGKCTACSGSKILVTDETSGQQACVTSVSYCKTYALAGACTQCNDKYSLYQGKCVWCDINGCDNCQTYNKCAQCQSGFQLSGSMCDRTVENCNAHDSYGECYKCNAPYTLSADKLSCNDCSSVANCGACSSQGECTGCPSGYTFVTSGTTTACVKTMTGCPNDQLTLDGKCKKCTEGTYSLNSEGKCVDCSISGCEHCEQSYRCDKCSGILVPSSNKYSCISCNVGNCKTCDYADSCGDCQDGFTRESGNCIKTIPDCSYYNTDGTCFTCSMSSGKEPSADGTKCVTCSSTCSACSDDNVCVECSTEEKINAQGDGCEECATGLVGSADSTQCITCDGTDCDKCSSPNVCSKCPYQEIINPSDPSSCGVTCTYPLQPSSDYKKCVECKDSHCYDCFDDNKCTRCGTGYTVKTDDFTCVEEIFGCTEYNADATCKTCDASLNLHVSTDKKACINCDTPNCKECSTNNVCGSCNTGYFLTGSKTCSNAIADCQNYDATGCTACTNGKVPSDTAQTCVTCGVSGCDKCSSDGVCVACAGANMVPSTDGSVCVAKIDNCEEYNNDGTCGQCTPSSNLKVSVNGKSCVQCSVLFCDSCSTDNVCVTCSNNKVPSLTGTCATKRNNCLTYHGNNDTCASCSNNLKPSNNGLACVTCEIKGCDKCNFDNSCAKCKGELKLSNDFTSCVPPVDGCDSYDPSGRCARCQDGNKVPSSNGLACVTCAVDDCDTCDGDNRCGICLQPSQFAPAQGGSACVPRLLHCNVHGLSGDCVSCESGYEKYLNDCIPTVYKDNNNKKDDDDGGVPWWVWLIVGLGAGVVVAGAVVLGVCLYMRRRRAAAAAAAAPFGAADGKKKEETASQGFDYGESNSNEPLR